MFLWLKTWLGNFLNRVFPPLVVDDEEDADDEIIETPVIMSIMDRGDRG